MNPTPSLLRPLQILAAVLAAVVAVLFVAWVRMDPPPVVTLPSQDDPVLEASQDPVTAGNVLAAAKIEEPPPAPTGLPAPAANAKAAAVLYGTMGHTDGSSVGSGYVWLAKGGKNVGSSSLRDGAFVFAGLQAGGYRLTSRIEDELPLDREVTVDAPVTRLDLMLEGRHVITVSAVTPDGKALAEALPFDKARLVGALAFDAPLVGDLPPSRSSEHSGGLGPFRKNDPIRGMGRGALPQPKRIVGVLTVPSGRPVHVALLLGTTLLAQQSVPAEQNELTFMVTPDAVLAKQCTIRVRFVDENGAPVADTPVGVSSASGSSTGPSMRTDANGRYESKGIMPGLIGIGMNVPDKMSPPGMYVVAPGEDLDLGDVVVRANTDFEFVMDNFGDRGTVWICAVDAPTRQGVQIEDRWLSRDNGAQQNCSLYPGRYTAVASTSNGVGMLDLDTASSPPQVRFVLQPAATLELELGNPDTITSVVIARRTGAAVRRLVSVRKSESITLPPGDYSATIIDQAGVNTRRDFTLTAAGFKLTLP